MRASRVVVLDNEAIQALSSIGHAKHRRALAIIEAVASRNLVRAGSVGLVVPTAVRVEAGWDRTRSKAAMLNRLRISDHVLDVPAANRAAAIRTALDVSVADAHIGCVLASEASSAVVTSDVDDLRQIADHLNIDTTIVRL